MITTFERSGLTFSITPLRHTAEVSEELIEHLQVGMAASCKCRVASKSLENGRAGSIASFERCRHVYFTPNYGRITATQRTDALGQSRHFAPLKNSEPFVRRTTAELVADLPIGA